MTFGEPWVSPHGRRGRSGAGRARGAWDTRTGSVDGTSNKTGRETQTVHGQARGEGDADRLLV